MELRGYIVRVRGYADEGIKEDRGVSRWIE